jgi:DNA-binding XRE family transcriptional regulator
MKSVFARNMHRIRSHHQYTQEQSAKIIGISRQALGSYEEGRAEPSIENLFKICKGYGIADVGNFLWNPEFLWRKDPPPSPSIRKHLWRRGIEASGGM